MTADGPPPAEVFAEATATYTASRDNLSIVLARAWKLDPDIGDDVWGFCSVFALLQDAGHTTTAGIAAAAITRLLQHAKSLRPPPSNGANDRT